MEKVTIQRPVAKKAGRGGGAQGPSFQTGCVHLPLRNSGEYS